MKYDIKKLTLEEKLNLLVGRNRWQLSNANGKLPDVNLADGPHGLRMQNLEDMSTYKATAMPCLHLIANTWDPELARLDGETIADDCLELGADVLLAPGVNIKRTPLCGRNFEYFSEDPYLAGVLAKSYIEGVQSKGVGTSLKHYCLNNLEQDRLYQSNDVDERTLREIYLPAFEIALQAKPWTVMCSYNLINGVYASENKWLLKDVLRDEFGFDGLIMSDWHATHSQFRASKATLDLSMPGEEIYRENLKNAFEKGWITEAEIDACVENILALMEKTSAPKQQPTMTKAERHARGVQIAKEGMVLLKNEDEILPLKGGKIVVGGTFKKGAPFGGGGSAYVQTEHENKPFDTLLQNALGSRAEVSMTDGFIAWERGYMVDLMRDTFERAYGADTVVLFVGNNLGDANEESECYDRTTLRLSLVQEELIMRTAEVNENVVVVLFTGSAVDVSPWIDKVKGVLYAGFAGEGAQEAVVSLLTGEACPCGKLSETFPVHLEDTPSADDVGNGFYNCYKEGIFVGYRWYDRQKKQVQFPFGHGLSYAQFEYSDLRIDKLSETDYEVSYTVKNTSERPAKEISQVYVKDVFAVVPRPEKELKGWAKTTLNAGESKRVTVTLNARSFAYYSIPKKGWSVDNGDFEIYVGASSRDIRLKGQIKITLPENEQLSQR